MIVAHESLQADDPLSGPEQCCLLCPKIPNHLNLDFLGYIAVFCAERVENLQFD